mmetsp:Transcript_30072/g.69520  ORF Transcript_30072/g.69520 Transcript_30072/m.69520 type:complete len:244 (-) Transcript_30072:364-1095(-)
MCSATSPRLLVVCPNAHRVEPALFGVVEHIEAPAHRAVHDKLLPREAVHGGKHKPTLELAHQGLFSDSRTRVHVRQRDVRELEPPHNATVTIVGESSIEVAPMHHSALRTPFQFGDVIVGRDGVAEVDCADDRELNDVEVDQGQRAAALRPRGHAVEGVGVLDQHRPLHRPCARKHCLLHGRVEGEEGRDGTPPPRRARHQQEVSPEDGQHTELAVGRHDLGAEAAAQGGGAEGVLDLQRNEP